MRGHHFARIAVGRDLFPSDGLVMIGAVHAIDGKNDDVPLDHQVIAVRCFPPNAGNYRDTPPSQPLGHESLQRSTSNASGA
jgi:hypothetical protein